MNIVLNWLVYRSSVWILIYFYISISIMKETNNAFQYSQICCVSTCCSLLVNVFLRRLNMMSIWCALIVMKTGLDTKHQFTPVFAPLILNTFVASRKDRNSLVCALRTYKPWSTINVQFFSYFAGNSRSQKPNKAQTKRANITCVHYFRGIFSCLLAHQQ